MRRKARVSLSLGMCVCLCMHRCVSMCVLQCSSGSSFLRFGGTVVIRIFTVASAELISKPVSLVSIESTEGAQRRGPGGWC